jgi:hypothetical protein
MLKTILVGFSAFSCAIAVTTAWARPSSGPERSTVAAISCDFNQGRDLEDMASLGSLEFTVDLNIKQVPARCPKPKECPLEGRKGSLVLQSVTHFEGKPLFALDPEESTIDKLVIYGPAGETSGELLAVLTVANPAAGKISAQGVLMLLDNPYMTASSRPVDCTVRLLKK